MMSSALAEIVFFWRFAGLFSLVATGSEFSSVTVVLSGSVFFALVSAAVDFPEELFDVFLAVLLLSPDSSMTVDSAFSAAAGTSAEAAFVDFADFFVEVFFFLGSRVVSVFFR